MSFSTDTAMLVADQLSRFVTLNRHHLAGQVENLDFWPAEVRHALGGIDNDGVRFVRMAAAEEQYVAAHGTEAHPRGTGLFQSVPPPPRRAPDRELRKARRALVEATIRFLERCRAERLVADAVVSAARAEFVA